MGIIRQEIEIFGSHKSKIVLALFDSGAYRNYMSKRLDDGDTPDDIGFHIYEGKHEAILANQNIAIGERVKFEKLSIDGRNAFTPSFVILDNMLEYVIVGVETMQEIGIILDFSTDKLIISK